MQHIEEAGIHSGDSACTAAALALAARDHRRDGAPGGIAGKALGVRGLMNIQFAVKDGDVYLIEVNPRASRTVPFVAKAIGQPVAKIAARVMAGEKLSRLSRRSSANADTWRSRKPCSRSRASPASIRCFQPGNEIDRRSDGDRCRLSPWPLPRAQLGAGTRCRWRDRAFVSVKDSDKAVILPAVKQLIDNWASPSSQPAAPSATWPMPGCRLSGSTRWPKGAAAYRRPIIDGDVTLIFNTTEGWQSLKDSQSIRGSALTGRVPYYHDRCRIGGCGRGDCCNAKYESAKLEVRSLQDYYSN
jgi:carbamoyl-phosphate synthase large subunit